ncbi:MAG: SDR family oxidoreductase [Candidatus Calescibacterium sp.]|nr:SDR family oxidoreductase [Candidatus Calescibacterium sp.]MDW8132487.1 SDR family oxidoreductase [Candidatus Calescibacterium sp.]
MERKFAFVSGNAKGIGKAITIRLIEKGYFVPIHYRKSEEQALVFKREIKEKYSIDVPLYKADLLDYNQVIDLIREVTNRNKVIDVIVNNVGDYLYKSILETSFDEWKYIIDSNLNTSFLLTSAFLPYIKRRIVFLGFAGTNMIKASPYTTAYDISKVGVLIYAKSLAKLLAKKGITVNVIGVGVAENSVTKPLKEIPMGRTALLTEICDAFEFLISDKSDYITGQLIEVAGGWKL